MKFTSCILLCILSIINIFANESSIENSQNIFWDYIIVGDGTAGALLARKLSDPVEDKCGCKHFKSVLVLEAGENRNDDPVILFPDFNVTSIRNILFNSPRYSVVYPCLLFNATEVITYSEGRGWGGGSMHNYLTAVRGTPRIYDFWAQFSNSPRWKYHHLLPVMKSIEHYTPDMTPLNPVQRGTHGPINITQYPPIDQDPFVIEIATQGNTAEGFLVDYNDPTYGNVGFSPYQQFITPPPNSIRSFGSREVLGVGTIINANGDGLHGRRLKLQSRAFVSRVLFRNKKAIGVEYILGNDPARTIQVFAKKVILCAGGVNSPAILQRSGIGPKHLLDSLKIETVVDNPNVGKHLINHYGTLGSITGTSTVSNILAFLDLRPYYPADGVRRLELEGKPEPGLVPFTGYILEAKSRGSVKIVSIDPLTQPIIDLNYYSDGDVSVPGTDAYTIVSFLKTLRDYAIITGGTVISPSPSDFASDATLLAYAKANVIMKNHIVGTTRMADSIENGVVDGKLRVFGVTNLYVADIGVCPRPTDGNTCFSAYVIGLNCAKILGIKVPPAK